METLASNVPEINPLPPSALADGTLVSSPINETYAELYPRTIRVKKPFKGIPPTPPDRSETTLQGFSSKSRGRLRFVSANASEKIISQFCLTYADWWPIDGRALKENLHSFLTNIRRTLKVGGFNLEYIWIAEFQTRGAPHFHFFSNLEVTDRNREIMANAWHAVAGCDDTKHKKFHFHKNNFIPWDMGNGSYLCKYLDKEQQKIIPRGFASFGRWWGNSRGLVPEPEIFDLHEYERRGGDTIDEETGEIETLRPATYALRIVGKHHERCNRRSFFRRTSKSTMHLTGAPIFRRIYSHTEAYLNERRAGIGTMGSQGQQGKNQSPRPRGFAEWSARQNRNLPQQVRPQPESSDQ